MGAAVLSSFSHSSLEFTDGHFPLQSRFTSGRSQAPYSLPGWSSVRAAGFGTGEAHNTVLLLAVHSSGASSLSFRASARILPGSRKPNR